jgi:hypothetical protein
MKKVFIVFAATALALGFVACTEKENITPTGGDTTPTEPTYQEGVYAPLMKIETLNYDDGTVQTWNWNGEQLMSVTEGNDSRQFTYSNGRIAQVSGTMSNLMGMIPNVTGVVSFTYNGNLLDKSTVNSDGTDLALMTFNHADGKISSVDAAVDAEYISGMLDGMMTGAKGQKINPKQILLDTSDNSIHAELVWEGKNVKQMVVMGNIPFELSKEAYETLKPYLPVEQAMLSLIDLYFLVSDAIPLQISISDTMDYTYDNKINPYYCYMGELVPANLSLNNYLTMSSHGTATISVTLTETPMKVVSQPINDYEEYTYEYNEKNYPTYVEGSKNYSITYKQ